MDVRFIQETEEADHYFRTSREEFPALLLLDCHKMDPQRLKPLLRLIRDVSPPTQIVAIGEEGGGGEADISFTRPVDAARIIELALQGSGGSTHSHQGIKGTMVTFSDSGIGIPATRAKRIFDPFFTTKEGSGGTGLGLSVVHKILEDHRAAIEVESSYGRGTTFSMSFPPGSYPGFDATHNLKGEKGKA